MTALALYLAAAALALAFMVGARKLTLRKAPSASRFHAECIARGLAPDHEARRRWPTTLKGNAP